MVHTALLIMTAFAGIFMAWSIGANDVANALGTPVGSGMISARKAVLLGGILMFSGAVLVGTNVTETIQKGIIDPAMFESKPELLTFGMLSSLLAAATWVAIATHYGLPVSSTHSIVGAVSGFGAIAIGVANMKTIELLKIVASWITSPIFAALLSFAVLKILHITIFSTKRPIKAAEKMGPLWVGIVFAIISFSVVYKGIKNIQFVPSFESAILISLLFGAVVYVISFFLFKRAEKKLKFEGKRVELLFGYLSILTGGYVAFGIGANDIANAMGPFAAMINIAMWE